MIHFKNILKEFLVESYGYDNINMDDSTKKLNKWLNETKKWMGILVENGDILYTNKLLTESQESKSIDAAKKLLMSELGYDREQADEFIRIKLRNDLPVLRDKNAAKFILGVTRMYIDGELNNAQTINRLNTTLKYVASDAHINEYDRNLNGMSSNELIERFSSNIEADIENDRSKVNAMQFENETQYEIVRIDSFEDASKYKTYTSWCVTRDWRMFDSYTSDGMNQFYFCLKRGFENVPEEVGENSPLDEYGLSMIAVCVDGNGALTTCTCRWNHDNGGNDNIMDTTQISQVIGQNFYNVFKPNNKWNELVNGILQKIKNGENYKDLFDDSTKFINGCAVVKLNGKYNYLTQEGTFLSPKLWFDNCRPFYNGDWAEVELNIKSNLINKNGKLLSNVWYDRILPFKADDTVNNVTIVRQGVKTNFIDTQGKILFPDIMFTNFDRIVCNGSNYYKVNCGNKVNYVDVIKRRLVWNKPIGEWFDFGGIWAMGKTDQYVMVEIEGNRFDLYLDSGRLLDKNGNSISSVPQQK